MVLGNLIFVFFFFFAAYRFPLFPGYLVSDTITESDWPGIKILRQLLTDSMEKAGSGFVDVGPTDCFPMVPCIGLRVLSVSLSVYHCKTLQGLLYSILCTYCCEGVSLFRSLSLVDCSWLNL